MDQQPEVTAPDAGARIEEIFRAFENKGAVEGATPAAYLFELEGTGGGRHLLRGAGGEVRWERDYAGDADVRVRLSVGDFLAIADGTFDGRLALASERIEISGDLAAAEKLLAAIEPEEA